MGRWLTVKQAAEELGITEKAVQRRIDRGTITGSEMQEGRRMIPFAAIFDQLPKDTKERVQVANEVTGLALLTELIEQAHVAGAKAELEAQTGKQITALQEAHALEVELRRLLAEEVVKVQGLTDQVEQLKRALLREARRGDRLEEMIRKLSVRQRDKIGFHDQDPESDAHRSDLTASQD